jgi:hypothetical protein
MCMGTWWSRCWGDQFNEDYEEREGREGLNRSDRSVEFVLLIGSQKFFPDKNTGREWGEAPRASG